MRKGESKVKRVRKPAEVSAAIRARKPSQERSRARFDELLDATAALISERGIREVGVYDIAERSKVPPTSVYHFFPTPEAALLALAERYLVELRRVIDKPIPDHLITRWSDLIAVRFARAVQFYNSNAAYGALFFSGAVNADIRRIDVENVSHASSISYQWLNQYFVMPYIPDHNEKFMVLIAIYDGIWMTSYARHQTITDYFANEALTAGLAYCRTFLPDVLARRVPDK